MEGKGQGNSCAGAVSLGTGLCSIPCSLCHLASRICLDTSWLLVAESGYPGHTNTVKRKAGSRRETWVLTAKGDALVRFRSGSYRWTKLEGLAANTSCLLLNVFDISGPLGLTGLLKKMSAEDKQYIYWAVFSKTLKTFLSYQSLGKSTAAIC